jgi:hypothetical protein
MMRALGRSLLAAWSLGVFLVLAGCSSGQVIDDLPANVGLPADAPARPAAPYQFPAVHDMPPPRTSEPMSAEDQLRLEKELTAARNRQEGRKPQDENALPAAKKNAKNTAKKKPADGSSGETAGAKTNP